MPISIPSIIISLAIIIMSLDVWGEIPASQYPESKGAKPDYPYICPTPGEITICAYDLCAQDDLPDDKDIADFKECGFNTFIQENGTIGFFDLLLNKIEGSGLKGIISNDALRGGPAIKRNLFIERFKGSSALGGWEMQDEPLYDALSAQGQVYSEIYDKDSLHLIHFNLVGEMARDFVGPQTPDLYAYLEVVRNKVSPGLWSFDYYPIKKIDNGPLTVDADMFYSALESYLRISKTTQRPFWSCCLSMGFRQGVVCKPSPTEEHLRFAAFSALAYGAQGIAYWTYRQRADRPGSSFLHLDAPVDIMGRKTKVWYAVKNVNKEIKKYNDVFYGADVLEVVHTGVKKYKNTKVLDAGFGPFVTLAGGEAGLLVSHIRNSGEDYIIIVNHDVERGQKIEFSLKKGASVWNMSDGKRFGWSSRKRNLSLDAGGYVIFKYSDQD